MNFLTCVRSGGPRSDQLSGDVTSAASTASDRKWAAASDGGNVEGRTGPNVGIVPDNQQLFVGNLPHNVDDDELVKFFTSESSVFHLPLFCLKKPVIFHYDRPVWALGL